MKYEQGEILERALKAIKEHRLFFVRDVVAYLPCNKSTFYSLFPDGSEGLDTIKEALENNKINIKVSMRAKWYTSDNPTLQVALMKIIATDEEAHRLNGTKIETESKVQIVKRPLFKRRSDVK